MTNYTSRVQYLSRNMKIRFILALLFLCPLRPVFSGIITGCVTNGLGQPDSSSLTFTPVPPTNGAALYNGASIISMLPVRFVPDENGCFTKYFTPGNYWLSSPIFSCPQWFSAPTNDGPIDWRVCMTNLVAYVPVTNNVYYQTITTNVTINYYSGSNGPSGGAVLSNLPVASVTGDSLVAGDTPSNVDSRFVVADIIALATNNAAPFPFVVVQTNGSFIANGTVYLNPGSMTAGIQEAIHWLLGTNGPNRKPGGTIYLAPGPFYTLTNILIPGPDWGTNMVTLNIEGSGKISSGITYVGSVTQEVMTVEPVYVGDPVGGNFPDTVSVSFKNMYMSSTLDGCTNILRITAAHPLGSYAGVGSVESADIYRCIFLYGAMTNSTWSHGPAGTTEFNLIGINVDCNFNDQITIRDSTFIGLNCGISFASDWGAIENNAFENCGIAGRWGQNLWPTNSPYWIGANVVFKEPSTGSYDGSGNYTGPLNDNFWWISGNEFVAAPLNYLAWLPVPSSYWQMAGTINIYGDGKEIDTAADPSAQPICATTGARFCFFTPKSYYIGYCDLGYYLTNWAQSGWSNAFSARNPCPHGMVKVLDPATYPYTMLDPTNVPVAGGNYGTRYNGTNFYFDSVVGWGNYTDASNSLVLAYGGAVVDLVPTNPALPHVAYSPISAQGFINQATGWAGGTNSAPGNTNSIVSWANYTNLSDGSVFKYPLYQ